MTLYQELKSAKCEIDSHESDLYVKATARALAIIAKYPNGYSRFISQIDGTYWLDIPFAFDPFWEKVASRTAR